MLFVHLFYTARQMYKNIIQMMHSVRIKPVSRRFFCSKTGCFSVLFAQDGLKPVLKRLEKRLF